MGDEPDASDELPLGEFYRISFFISIMDSLISALSRRIAAYSDLSEKFCFFFAKLGFEETSNDDLCSAARKLIASYPEDLEPELEKELVHFNAFWKSLRKGGALDNDKISDSDMLLFTDDNSLYESFANVAIALKVYLCMLVTNCKGDPSFPKLKLILNYYLLEKLNGAEEFVVFGHSIESQLLRGMDFSSVTDSFAEDKTSHKYISI